MNHAARKLAAQAVGVVVLSFVLLLFFAVARIAQEFTALILP